MAEEDLLFGKNRHMFGGIEPSNMLYFSAYARDDGQVKIEAQLPYDTEILNQTLCTVAGAVIRRGTTEYPETEFDGDYVTTFKAGEGDKNGYFSFLDTSTKIGNTYFYSAFPYTTQGVYNKSPENRAGVNEPKPMVEFNVESTYNSTTKVISLLAKATCPDTAVGAKVLMKKSGYPTSETDGTVVWDIDNTTIPDTSKIIVESAVEGTTYYFTAFPYTNSKIYNRDVSNRCSVTARARNYLYGYDLDTTNSSPAKRVTYPSDVDNCSYVAAAMNFTTGVFSYGDWPSEAGSKFMPRPCMLRMDGTLDVYDEADGTLYYLDPDNYGMIVASETHAGDPSDVANTAYDGNAMMEWPLIYVKRWETEGVYHFRCSDVPEDTTWDCWSNYDKDNNIIEHFYTPIYEGCLDANQRLRSISGKTIASLMTSSEFISYASGNGSDIWGVECFSDYLLIQDLLVMMAKTTNCQNAYGYGFGASANETALVTGTMDKKGLFYGSKNCASEGVKVFGMENWWGNMQRYISGCVYDNGTFKLKMTRGTHDESTYTGYDQDGLGYISIDNSTITGTSGGYISSMITTTYGRLPSVASGTSSTYESDSITFKNDRICHCYVGGYWHQDASNLGPFKYAVDSDSENSSKYRTACLSCKPLKE
jgi:hypothetical protein